jgi:hypothetical protein
MLSMKTELEFWPDYGSGPLWSTNGTVVDGAAIGLQPDLLFRLRTWNSAYAEDKLPMDKISTNPGWIEQGRDLLAEIRQALGEGYELKTTEPWWGDSADE